MDDVSEWAQGLKLSRKITGLGKDFSDAVLAAEIIFLYEPAMVQLHSYSSAVSKGRKRGNWEELNRNALKKLGLELSADKIEKIVHSAPNFVENFLRELKIRLLKFAEQKAGGLKGRKFEIDVGKPEDGGSGPKFVTKDGQVGHGGRFSLDFKNISGDKGVPTLSPRRLVQVSPRQLVKSSPRQLVKSSPRQLVKSSRSDLNPGFGKEILARGRFSCLGFEENA
jgi:hypothetical protein